VAEHSRESALVLVACRSKTLGGFIAWPPRSAILIRPSCVAHRGHHRGVEGRPLSRGPQGRPGALLEGEELVDVTAGPLNYPASFASSVSEAIQSPGDRADC